MAFVDPNSRPYIYGKMLGRRSLFAGLEISPEYLEAADRTMLHPFILLHLYLSFQNDNPPKGLIQW